jgi:putative DNA primase/helicase
MVALVTGPDEGPTAVHRTFLTANGEKAPVNMPKMALGPLKGGAVELGTPEAITGVSEGIETGLSALQIHGVPVLAALGTRMDRVQLPEAASHIVVFGDNGDVGRRAAREAQMAILRTGRTVDLCFPPAGYGDWNDVVRDRTE